MKYSVSLPIIVAAFFAISCQKNESFSPNADNPVKEESIIGNDLIIKVSEELACSIEDSHGVILEGLTFERTFPDGGIYEKRMKKAGLDLWYTVKGRTDMPLTKAGDILSGLDGVELVERVPAVSTRSISWNDPYFGKQWYLINKGNVINKLKAGCDIGVENVWERGIVGDDRVVVAVIDGGVDLKHEDLIDNLWTGRSEEGKIIHGRNFCNDTYEVNADDHGTHVAGIISAVNNNGIGTSGIAGGDASNGIRGVQIMSCQIISEVRGGDGATAIVWAANHGAVIAQNSWGYDPKETVDMTDTPRYMKAAIDYFNENAGCDEDGNQLPGSPMKGGVVIFAAGNESSSKGFPASYEGCIAVGSVSGDYNPAYYTNFGDWVDIAAPGGDANKNQQIYSTIVGNQYGNMQGTSMACPSVSGVAALILSEFGGQGFTREMLVERLLKTTRNIDFGKKIGGLVNAEDALAHYDDYEPSVPEIAGYRRRSATSFEVDVVIPEGNGDVQCRSISLFYGKNALSSIKDAERSEFESTEGYQPGDTLIFRVERLELETEYHFTAVGNDAMSRPSKLSVPISILVESNKAPEIVPEGETDITIKKHEKASMNFLVRDSDGDPVSCTMESNIRNGISFSFGGSLATVAIDGVAAKSGVYTGKLTARDDSGAESTMDFSITVLENHAPVRVAEIKDIMCSLGDEPTKLDLSKYFSDEDGETLSYKVTAASDSSPCKLEVENGILTITGKKIGCIMLSVTAEDANGEVANASFRYLCRNGEEELEAYPVPVETILYLRAASSFSSEVKIYNASGACVFKEKVMSDPFDPAMVDLSALKTGKYTLSTEINGKTIKKNIIKK